jgi:signal transduction histidine kinase
MGAFLGVSLLALTLQYLVFQRLLADAATTLPTDGALLLSQTNTRLMTVFFTSVALLLPATFAVGLVVTHRLIGPIYRFEVYLKQVISRETTEPCRIRKGDELQDLCDLINTATEPVRKAANDRAQRREAA